VVDHGGTRNWTHRPKHNRPRLTRVPFGEEALGRALLELRAAGLGLAVQRQALASRRLRRVLCGGPDLQSATTGPD